MDCHPTRSRFAARPFRRGRFGASSRGGGAPAQPALAAADGAAGVSGRVHGVLLRAGAADASLGRVAASGLALRATPEAEELDAERLTESLQAAQLVQAWNEAANAALRGFCARVAAKGAATLWNDAVENPGNGETEGETEGEGVAEGIVRLMREFYTEFGNAGALLAEKPVKPRDPSPETFRTAGITEELEEGEMYAYIEKTMATRVKVLPLEVRAGMQDVWMALLRTMMKNLQEEVRASVLYDYQFRCLVVNLAFVFSMTSCLLEEEAKELREVVQGVIRSAWERCYEPSEVTEEQQKSAVENGIVEFMMMVSE